MKNLNLRQIKYYFKQHKAVTNIIILMSFFILSLLSIYLLIHNGMVYGSSDIQFHSLRIQELYKSMSNGYFWPQFNLNTFNSNGVAILALYPYLNLYPIAFLMFLTKDPIIIYYGFFIFNTFIAMIISFYSSIKFSQNYYISYLFAISYTLSMNFFGSFFNNGDLGNFSSLAILPLIIFGMVKLIKYDKWIQLSIGMAILLYIHILNFTLVTIILMIFIVINYKCINIKYLIKSIVLTSLLGALHWITFLKLMFLNNINNPMNHLNTIANNLDPNTKAPIYGNNLSPNFSLIGTKFTDLFNGMTSGFQQGVSTQYSTLGITSLFSIILGAFLYKKMNNIDKQFYFISIGIIILASSLFPWQLFNNNKIINVIQFPYRLYIFPALLLNYLFAKLVIVVLKNNTFNKFISIFSIIILVIILNQISYQLTEINTQGNNNINNTILNQSKIYGNFDYIPIPALSNYNNLESSKSTYQYKNTIRTIYFDNKNNGKLTFYSKNHIKDLAIPFVVYNGINYKVKLDNKTVPFRSNNQNIVIPNIESGNHSIRIIPNNNSTIIFSIIYIIIGLYFLILNIIKKKKCHANLKNKLLK